MKFKINKQQLLCLAKNIIVPLFLGIIAGVLSGSSAGYKDFIKPSFAPPKILFPIIWTLLYILMGISTYIIFQTNSIERKKALRLYYVQLILNVLWSFIFFKFKLLLLAALWIVILIILVVKMIIQFYTINSVSAYLQIPYLIWLVFAFILNTAIYFINY